MNNVQEITNKQKRFADQERPTFLSFLSKYQLNDEKLPAISVEYLRCLLVFTSSVKRRGVE